MAIRAISDDIDTGIESDKHPKGLYVLFATEMWERFSFYTMVSMFTLYLRDDNANSLTKIFWCPDGAGSTCVDEAKLDPTLFESQVAQAKAQLNQTKASLENAFHGAPPGEGGFIADWMDLIEHERDRILGELGDGRAAVRALEQACVQVSLANLRTFPFVPDREKTGALRLRGAYFAIAEGVLHLLDEASGTFKAAQG